MFSSNFQVFPWAGFNEQEFPPKVESKQVVLVKDQSKRGTMETQSTNQSPKCVTRQEAFVEVGFQRNCRL